ncbi:MAG: SoxR reducing system RseC family protein, partial [Oscillospiraceae bacterium]|nr:SoxR reducing system RseC family protein [Oscillospiraceae bacterium]
MTNTATVVKLESARRATVRVTRENACGDCGKCKGCPNPREMVYVTAKNPIGAEPGDQVVVTAGTRQILSLAALVYLLPVVLFLAGWLISGSLWGAAAGAAVSVAAAFGVNRRIT